MSAGAKEPKCGHCKKGASQGVAVLKACAQCKTTSYCGKE